MIDVAHLYYDLITSSRESIKSLLTPASLGVVLSEKSLGRLSIGQHRTDNQLFVTMEDRTFPFLWSAGLFITMDDDAFPFLWAAGHWAEHAKVIEAANDDIPRSVMQLYRQEDLWRSFPQILGSESMYDHEIQPHWFDVTDYKSEPLMLAFGGWRFQHSVSWNLMPTFPRRGILLAPSMPLRVLDITVLSKCF